MVLVPIIYERGGVDLCASSVLYRSFTRSMLYRTHARLLA
jgi:hypothetical protein